MQSKHVSLSAARPLQPILAAWALTSANALGADFLQWLIFEASIIHRQVSFAVFAKRLLDGVEVSEQSLRALAKALRDGDPRDVIAVTFGECVHGQITGFARIGADAFPDPASYLLHHQLYADPSNHVRLRIGQHCGRLTEDRLKVLFEIDAAFLTVDFVRRTPLTKARLVRTVLEAIQERSPSEAMPALAASMQSGSTGRPFRDTLLSWLAWCRFDEAPNFDEPSLGVSVIRTARNLIDKSREYQNCAGRLNRLIDAAAGRAAYLVYEPYGQPIAMSMLLPATNGGWLIEGIYGVNNAVVSDAVQMPLRDWLASCGVHGVGRPCLTAEWAAAFQLLGANEQEMVEFDDLNDLLALAA